MSGPDGAFSDGAFRVVPIGVPCLVRPLRNACVGTGRALEPLDVADTDIAVAGGSRLRALLVKQAAVLGTRPRRRIARQEHRSACADGQEPALRVARLRDHGRPSTHRMDREDELQRQSPAGCTLTAWDVGWASGEAAGGVWSGDGVEGGSGWPIASRIVAISSCCFTMISWAMRRSCSLRP